jgi:hypothetical protein
MLDLSPDEKFAAFEETFNVSFDEFLQKGMMAKAKDEETIFQFDTPIFGLTHDNCNRCGKNYLAKLSQNTFNSMFVIGALKLLNARKHDMAFIKIKDDDFHFQMDKSENIFGVDLDDHSVTWNFEGTWKFPTKRERTADVVLGRLNKPLFPLEIKLCAVPKGGGKDVATEMIARPLVLEYIANSLFFNNQETIRPILTFSPMIKYSQENYAVIRTLILEAIRNCSTQTPLIVQGIMKYQNAFTHKPADDCFDVFIWSDAALVWLLCAEDKANASKVSREMGAIMAIYEMLNCLATGKKFDATEVIDRCSKLSPRMTDKAMHFGHIDTILNKTGMLTKPRLHRTDARHIIRNKDIALFGNRTAQFSIATVPHLFGF